MRKIKQTPRSRALPVLLTLFGLFGVLLLFLLFRSRGDTPLVLNSLNNNNVGKESTPDNSLVNTNHSTNTTSAPTTNVTKPKGSTTTPSTPQSRTAPEIQIPYLWKCFGEKARCTIATNDRIYDVLEQEENSVRVFINGAWIEPKTVLFQLNQKTYSDEVISDATGKTLLSSGKEYNPKMGTLMLWVGMNASYYNSISPKERQTLYLEQLVRTLTALFGKSPNNFITVQNAVQLLHSWQPSVKK